MRRFYQVYSDRGNYEKLSRKLENTEINDNIMWQKHSNKLPKFTLSWSHYLILMRIENPEKRHFYENVKLKAHNFIFPPPTYIFSVSGISKFERKYQNKKENLWGIKLMEQISKDLQTSIDIMVSYTIIAIIMLLKI